MESTIPNERVLRKVTLGTLLPAFPLIIAAGAMSSKSSSWSWRYHYRSHTDPTIIFFGLIPTFWSAITSALYLRTTEDPFAKRPSWRAGLWFVIDLFLAMANLAILIPVWIFEPGWMNGHADWMMLETYATVFLMSNMFIHAYLALYHPIKLLYKSRNFCMFQDECPHCHGKLRAVETLGGKREGYSLLRAEEYLDEPESEGEASTGIARKSTNTEV